MNKLILNLSLMILCIAPFANATNQVDLGDDIMKPMGKLMQQVVADIADGSKNAVTIENIKKIEGYVDQALTVDPSSRSLALIPDTDNYKAEAALVGEDLALTKYTGLLQALKVTLIEFAATVSSAKADACGKPCTDKLTQLKEIQDVGHSVFRDSSPPPQK